MGSLRLFSRKQNLSPGLTAEDDNNKVKEPASVEFKNLSPDGGRGLDSVYAFFLNDYESRGYNDALANPDESYKKDNIRLLNHDLLILIERTSTYYEDLSKEVEFHISSRSRAGMVDLVEELKIRMQIINEHREKLKTFKEEAVNGTGPVERIGLSYQRGFMRGLSSISQAKVFNNR
jgi:hypothetical protein